MPSGRLRRAACAAYVIAVATTLTLAGCGKAPATYSNSDNTGRSTRANPARTDPNQGGITGSMEQKRAELLNRIRAADPQHTTIERALINEQNELGLIVSRKVELDDLPKLTRSMLVQMAEAFPNQDLSVVAYTPTEPPLRLGTARLNARTRDMTYTPASAR